MGCTASKLDNEDTVRRCKDRRRLIKEAVHARHHLASAHSDYCRSLKLTASALLTFAQGESLSVSEQTPAVFLHPPPPHPRSHTPPPHLHTPPPPPFQPSPTIPSSKLPHILSSSSISSNNNSNDAINNNKSNSNKNSTNIRKFKKPHHLKLPHILSESSVSSSPKSNVFDYPTAFQSNYSNTPSQASSAWNWENFYPPSPPDSEFFNRKNFAGKFESGHDGDTETETETETQRSEYDFFQVKKSPPEHRRSSVVGSERNGGEMEREEVHCSEWGDHDHDRYSTSDSEMEEEDDDEVAAERAESAKEMPRVEEKEEAGSSASYRTNADVGDMKMVVRHKDLREIVEALKENFDKAAAAGDQVSEILEVGRAQLDRSFRQLKKTVYHSSSMLSNLSSSWTSKPPLAVKYRLDTVSLNQPGGLKSLCSTMERLLAWERKLYEEVKAREGVKIEHERKLATLQSQEYKGEEDAKLDKTKTSITRLNSLLVVTSQAVTTTSTAIISLRDSDLVPQLVELCHGFMYMWRAMHQFHEVQNHIVQQVRGLVNRSVKGDSTSELHRQATRDLESAVSAWHSSFCRIIKFQRDFIRSVHGWFKLTLLPVSADEINSNMERSDVYAFCDEWKLALDRVPDTVASEAIKSFINVVHAITVKQTEEHKIRKRTETASKELEKKASSLRNIERKYYQSYSMVGIGLPDTGPDNGQALDARDPLAEKKSELAACQRRVEDEMLRHANAVEVTRAMTLNHLQTGLPGVFQALTSFSALFTEALESVCNRSYAIK